MNTKRQGESELRGHFIAFAGTDGSGKTTQAELAGEWLRSLGFSTTVVAFSSPSLARKVLTDLADGEGLDDHMDLLGPAMTRFVGAVLRYRDWSESLIPALQRDDFVVVDRYVACLYASVRALEAGNEELLRRMFRHFPVPDMSVLIQVDPEVALERLHRRGVDSERPEYLRAFADAYGKIPEFQDFTIVDGAGDTTSVERAVRHSITTRFPVVAERRWLREPT